MERRDLEAYLGRDWARVARLKEEHWRARRARLGAAEALRVMSELRAHAWTLDAAWPSAGDREEDLEIHARVARALRATAERRR